jgi:2-alkyl-3-oxoalkanoate reductase
VTTAAAVPGRTLLTGASGFIGGAVLAELAGRARPGGGPLVRALVHARALTGDVERLPADLGAPETLRGACEGVDTVIHAATHIGADAGACARINARGTEALVAEAARAGVRRFVYVSNAAVCGWAVQRGPDEDAAAVQPVTPVSRSRVAAERAVLAAGGLVLRPLFVYGRGDTRFVPAIARALRRRLPFRPAGGHARVSVIAADVLAAAICDLCAAPTWSPGVVHANDGQPPSLNEIVDTLARHLGTARPRLSIPWPLLALAARALPGHAGARVTAAHRLFLVSRDHTFDSARLWRLLGRAPGPPFAERFAAYRDDYARALAVTPR